MNDELSGCAGPDGQLTVASGKWAASPQESQEVFNARTLVLANPTTSDARKDAATQSLFPRMTDLRLRYQRIEAQRNQGHQGLQRHQGRALRRMMNDE